VGQAQQRLDHILKLAESGRTFSPSELLALQAHVYRASQELDLAGKVVEKATGGVKQVLQTQV
ncbi:MAG: ATP-dependent helicase HrpB, partial [Myxococcaceae bacterium]